MILDALKEFGDREIASIAIFIEGWGLSIGEIEGINSAIRCFKVKPNYAKGIACRFFSQPRAASASSRVSGSPTCRSNCLSRGYDRLPA